MPFCSAIRPNFATFFLGFYLIFCIDKIWVQDRKLEISPTPQAYSRDIRKHLPNSNNLYYKTLVKKSIKKFVKQPH